MKTILLVYPGLGKTYAASKTNKVLEIQLSQFENINVKKLGEHFPEHLKGVYEVEFCPDPDFPNNVINCINKGFEDGRIPVMALKTSNIEFVTKYNFDFAFVVPASDKVEQLKQQYIERNNTESYIERNMKLLDKVAQDMPKYGKQIYYIHKDEHLLDLINKL